MSDAVTKQSRRVLRLVHEHLTQAHVWMGAIQESVGLVDVIYHPEKRMPYLNHVSPRRNTAWIPGPALEEGIARLRSLGRIPRVSYFEGLFPPQFARTVRGLGLEIESEQPIMTYTANGHTGPLVALPENVRFSEVNTQHSSALWWYVWRNAYFDVIANGVEPIYIGQTMREIGLGHQVDLLLYRNEFPVGVARLTLHNTTAHIAAFAIMKEARTPEMLRCLYQISLKTALKKCCTLVFTSSLDDEGRRLCRALGFVDSGSAVYYTGQNLPEEEGEQDAVAQPVFVL